MPETENVPSGQWKPRRVHLFVPHRERARRIGERLQRMLETAGLPLAPQPEGRDDLVITVGGDGTFLRALHRYHAVDPVFCGVNAGHLGFLHEIDEDNLIPAVDRILKGQFAIETFDSLTVDVAAAGGSSRRYQAFNDVVVERRDTRTLRLTPKVDGHDLGPLVGDGLLITTASGSTGYALAARGAIIHPHCPALQILPLHAHRSRIAYALDAPLVVPIEATIEVEVTWAHHRTPRLVIDGEELPFNEGERVRVRRADVRVRVLRLGIADFWQRLRDKIL